jgi:exodeoxyribonuclease VII large subunit
MAMDDLPQGPVLRPVSRRRAPARKDAGGASPDESGLGAVPGNVPEYSVGEISGAVKRTLEGAFGRVRVRGEITECKRYGSGHIYLSLKDETAKLACVIWKSAAHRLALEPENGVEVIATGRLTAYGERSSYQLMIERLEYAGAGALLARVEMLRVRLAEEGLFDPARRRALPRLPLVVGVVTSAQGAVWHDIQTTIARRFPRALLLWPVPVQGQGAAARIAAAIRGMDALPPRGGVDALPPRGGVDALPPRGGVDVLPPQGGGGAPARITRPDVLIVARGGGSLEDLMAFNDEAVVRAAAACRIPLISAVGHETDTTLLDFVADRRAPTPTAAAEMAVPQRLELLADLGHIAARLDGAVGRMAQARRIRLDRAAGRLPDLPALLGTARQRLDDRAQRLGLAAGNLVARRTARLAGVAHRLPDGPALLRGLRMVVADRGLRLRLALPGLLARRGTSLARAAHGLRDPASMLAARRASLALAAANLRAGLRHAVRQRAAEASAVLPRLSDAALRATLRERRARLEGLAARLDSVSYEAVLARGFVLVLDAKGRAVPRAEQMPRDGRVRLRFSDGEVQVGTASARDRQGRFDL